MHSIWYCYYERGLFVLGYIRTERNHSLCQAPSGNMEYVDFLWLTGSVTLLTSNF